MLVEVPEKFLQKNQTTRFQKVFINTMNVTLLKAEGYDYGNGIEYSISLCLEGGHYIPLAYGVNEKLILEFTYWFNDLIYSKDK